MQEKFKFQFASNETVKACTLWKSIILVAMEATAHFASMGYMFKMMICHDYVSLLEHNGTICTRCICALPHWKIGTSQPLSLLCLFGHVVISHGHDMRKMMEGGRLWTKQLSILDLDCE